MGDYNKKVIGYEFQYLKGINTGQRAWFNGWSQLYQTPLVQCQCVHSRVVFPVENVLKTCSLFLYFLYFESIFWYLNLGFRIYGSKHLLVCSLFDATHNKLWLGHEKIFSCPPMINCIYWHWYYYYIYTYVHTWSIMVIKCYLDIII